MVRALIYAQIIHPASKLKLSEEVIPSIYKSNKYSEDQIYEALRYIGGDYKKFIELFNREIGRKYLRTYNTLYFDCTNYYFEIDYEKDDKQKGPSKENRHSPIIGQALLLDSEGIPLAMEMYPGNQSEKPMIRKIIDDTKKRYGIIGKIIQVADKGLNCAKNIYLAKKNYDGYIFSKSIHGRSLSETEKKWVLLNNGFKEVYDDNNKVKFKYKECVDFFNYKFIDENDVEHKFKVKEKRVVTFNPSLAKKQIQEMNKEIEKAKTLNTIKIAERSEYGDAAKYVIFEAKNKEGKVIKIQPKLNEEKILEDKKMAGYNLLVSSEYKANGLEIYNVYHNLSKIEESFRITKSVLEARPINLQNKEEIYGHFTICFLSLLLLRFLEIKVFNKRVNTYDIVNFIKSFQITKFDDDIFVNNLRSNNKALIKINSELQNEKINYLYLNKKDIKEILKIKV